MYPLVAPPTATLRGGVMRRVLSPSRLPTSEGGREPIRTRRFTYVYTRVSRSWAPARRTTRNATESNVQTNKCKFPSSRVPCTFEFEHAGSGLVFGRGSALGWARFWSLLGCAGGTGSFADRSSDGLPSVTWSSLGPVLGWGSLLGCAGGVGSLGGLRSWCMSCLL